uniref:Uncharacterized protein n=1 Tax=Homalodisca liturata TaxID=320908 RepID=A0A1B6JQC1_9HEMI
MKFCVTLVVYLSITSAPRCESLFSTTDNLLHATTTTTVTPVLRDYEKEAMKTTASTSSFGYSNQLRPVDPNESTDEINRLPPSTPDNPLTSTQQTSRGDDNSLIYLDSVSCVPKEEQSTTSERVDRPNRRYPVTSTTSRPPTSHVPVPVDGNRRILDGPVKVCGPGMKTTANGDCREQARK